MFKLTSVQDPTSNEITGFVSYYSIPNTITSSGDKDFLLAAFLWFYAVKDEETLPLLMKDALVSAKNVGSVFTIIVCVFMGSM